MRRATHRTTSRALVPALILLSALAACEPATAPTESPLNAREALADYQAMQKVFTTQGWAGLQALGGRTPLAAGAAATVLRTLPGVPGERTGRNFTVAFLRDLAAVKASHGTQETLARTVISPVHLGRTWVYDAALDRYVIDPRRTGAPANGTRFIVYELDAAKKPIVSREIGHADLLDEGANTGSAVVLRLILVERGRTIVDYRTRADLKGDMGEVDVDGYGMDEKGTRLSFDIDVTARQLGGDTRIDADFELALEPRGFTATGAVRGVKEGNGGGGSISLTLRHEANVLKVQATEANQKIDGSMELNGKLFVRITGDAKAPTLRGPNGEPLTNEQLAFVAAIVVMSEDVFDLVEDLVEPVDNLLLLGWIL
ncbi:MAG: hypothetical protein IT361_01775 [Gemmatimonadaceae bacterium]|nr:hypothetical protein [Gemmatimonadaceae bacterium]